MSGGRRAHQAGEPAEQPRRQLRLVGLPYPARLVRHQLPAPLSYGVDYSFLHTRGRWVPVRWPAGRTITVRLAGPDLLPPDLDLSPIIDELAELTGLGLQLGEPLPDSWQPTEPAVDQILLCRFPALPTTDAGMRCVGTAIRAGQYGDYLSGLVMVGGSRNQAGRLGWQLRHGLGHALGLGHAHRASELMYSDDLGTVGWGPGDRAGLRLIGHQPIEP